MLILNETFKNGDIVSIKLSSGEEIIGKLIDNSDKDVTVNMPMLVGLCAEGIELSVFLLSASHPHNLQVTRNHIIAMTHCDSVIADSYHEQIAGATFNVPENFN